MENEQNRSSNDTRRRHSQDDEDPIRNYMKLSREKIKVVQTKVLKAEEHLNTELEAVLNDKQFKKWIKYQTKLKKDNAPKKEASQSQNQNSGNRNGRQGGPPGGGNRF